MASSPTTELKRCIVEYLNENGIYDEDTAVKAYHIGQALGVSKSTANSSLYKLKNKGSVKLVVNEIGLKPKWYTDE